MSEPEKICMVIPSEEVRKRIDDKVVDWHHLDAGDVLLNEHLGWTKEEYKIWAETSKVPIREI